MLAGLIMLAFFQKHQLGEDQVDVVTICHLFGADMGLV